MTWLSCDPSGCKYPFILLTGQRAGESVMRGCPLLRELSCATLLNSFLKNSFLPHPVIPIVGSWISSTVPILPLAFLSCFLSVFLHLFSERFPHTSSSSSSLTLFPTSEITFLIFKRSLILFPLLLIPFPQYYILIFKCYIFSRY